MDDDSVSNSPNSKHKLVDENLIIMKGVDNEC